MTKITHNANSDTVSIFFCDTPVKATENRPNGLILYYDGGRRLIGLEILEASKHVAWPHRLELAETSAV
ncbi:hypothetical protein CCAX7_64870 [Capsulimonas corticalis]|uniref:Uncharacterized protein n=1 Tax=Capsulimonas corticalis TaxID=2219043 RepID=A0A402CQM5_9BACT|nr:DUF2283 domain-containing protein [Capsulimonas corticalis]BDI34436.1 hypothetical protein CCAX7_64870 [Capsulimonas corticalis]